MKNIVFIAVLMVLSIDVLAGNDKRPWYIADFHSLQYAGNMGLFSVAAGKLHFNNKLQTSILYGFAPRQVAGKPIHTLGLRNTFDLFSRPLAGKGPIDFYINAGMIFETGNHSELKLPNKYPDGYYATNSFHFPISLGARYTHKSSSEKIDRVSYFAEVGSLAVYMYYNVVARQFRTNSIYSLSFGMSVYY